ncbi:MAG: rod shape-determining protein RodA [Deinococcota bacterium]|nr:rod shape-determining protein RodA [Deinococcota bacterium]
MSKLELGMPILTALILAVGLLTLNSAAPADGTLAQQLLYLALSLPVCLLVLWLGRERLVRLAPAAYAVTLLLLVATLLLMPEVYGARRWLKLGPLPAFQPSEFAKLALLLSLAVSLHERPIRGLLAYLRPLALIGVPATLVLMGPDLGGALVMGALGFGILFVRGLPLRHVLVFSLVLLLAAPTLVWPNLRPHQQERVVTFLNPTADPQGSGYQVIQSRIAVGSGGLFGKGYQQGTQSQLDFIPFKQTDFIYPVLAEEAGFVGAAGLILLFALLFWRLAAMAVECPRERDQLIITGVLSLIGFQVLVNIGVSLGLAPVTGITLPLVSYGGTSLIATLAALAIAFTVHRDRYEDW